MNQICDLVCQNVEVFGVCVIDVCLICIDLFEQNLNVIYVWMCVECECEVVDEIVCGGEVVQCVCVVVDCIVVELILEVCKKVEIVCGEVDVCCNVIYVVVFGCDFEFFVFICLMILYEWVLKGENSLLVIQLEGEFFDYLCSDGVDWVNFVLVVFSVVFLVVLGENVVMDEILIEDIVLLFEINCEGQFLGENVGVMLMLMLELLFSLL